MITTHNHVLSMCVMSVTRILLNLNLVGLIQYYQTNIFYHTNLVALVNKKYILKKLNRIARENMNGNRNSNLLSPPENIRGLTILHKNEFNKQIQISVIELGDVIISKIMPYLKKYLLKMENLKPVQVNGTSKLVLLNPVLVTQWSDIDFKDRDNLGNIGISELNHKRIDFTLTYDNWRADELLKYILPDDKTSVAGFSKIGHIIHLNLRDHVMQYKHIIGQILLEKIPGARTVVNKLDKIDSTYRNFQMEILSGDTDMLVQVKENRCSFEFDFSTVYWNPRLSTEHERITNILKSGNILYDIFAGVGPFSIPAAKNKCIVFANDLNPESYKWLNHNAKINKIKNDLLSTYNKDGREFITNEIKDDLRKRLNAKENCIIHITMNLPAMATYFLNEFSGLYESSELENINLNNFPTVHVYCFAKGEDPIQIARDLIELGLGHKLTDNLLEIFNVRKVSSYKEMMRVSFKLTKEILIRPAGFKRKSVEDCFSNDYKKCV